MWRLVEDILSIRYDSKSVHTYGVFAVFNAISAKQYLITSELSSCQDLMQFIFVSSVHNATKPTVLYQKDLTDISTFLQERQKRDFKHCPYHYFSANNSLLCS